jgi:negative regulator of sigma E activity
MASTYCHPTNDAESVDETNQSVASDKVLKDDSSRTENILNCDSTDQEKIRKAEWISYFTISTVVAAIVIATTTVLVSYHSYQNDQQTQFDVDVSIMNEFSKHYLETFNLMSI